MGKQIIEWNRFNLEIAIILGPLYTHVHKGYHCSCQISLHHAYNSKYTYTLNDICSLDRRPVSRTAILTPPAHFKDVWSSWPLILTVTDVEFNRLAFSTH